MEKIDSFPVRKWKMFSEKTKILKTILLFLVRGLDIYNDQIYGLRAIIEGAGYDINISYCRIFKKGCNNIFSVAKDLLIIMSI